MSWVKLDDQMGDHRKVRRALSDSRPALALHFLAILHCARYLTDGFVDQRFVDDTLPKRERNSAVSALIANGLWKTEREGFRVHDYLDYNPTREKVQALRASDAERKRGQRTESKPSPNGFRADSVTNPNGVQSASDRPVPYPSFKDPPSPLKGGNPPSDRTAPEAPPRPEGKRKSVVEAWHAELAAWGEHHFPGVDPVVIGHAVGWLVPRTEGPVTVDDVRALAASSDLWGQPFGIEGVSS